TTEFCGPDVVGYVYSWSGPGGFSAATRCTGPIGTAGTYTVTITDANGCQSTCDTTLTVYPAPVCDARPADTTVCEGTTAVFVDFTTGGTTPYTYCWQKEPYDGACLSTSAQLTIFAGETDAGYYRVIVTDSHGCADTCFVHLNVEPCGGYCTYTMGGWGSGCPDAPEEGMPETQPGCIRDNYFDEVFPDGVTIGDPAGVGAGSPTLFAMHFTSAQAVEDFLPSGGTACVLAADFIDPATGEGGGVLAGQILALTLNVEYSCEGVFDELELLEGVSCYGDFVIPEECGKFEGLTVEEFLAVANLALADSLEVLTPYGASLSDVNFTATCLNEMFNNCEGPDQEPGTDGTAFLSRPEGELADKSGTVDVGETPALPKEFKVNQSYPNPFNPSATIEFALPSEGDVTIAIYDAIGRKVVTLLSEHRSAGYHQVTWLGKDEGGTAVASGVYFCRVQFGAKAAIQKMILLR
ncbi:MAG: T9SS type A sorting domain-containing protein, partial [Candidatus Eisenbacteria bacterium]|nr:T9SS type A sorting domain-containing protein [Candidatus Eisenbacteria bacterium]